MTLVYACTTPTCDERLRGTCDEPTFCSICLCDLTPIVLDDGVTPADITRPYDHEVTTA